MRLPDTPSARFLRENFQWMIASLLMAFGVWIMAVLQSNPIQQRDYPRSVNINFVLADDMKMSDPSVQAVTVTIRAPRSVWDVLRTDQIRVTADLTDLEEGPQTVDLEAELEDRVRGQIVDIRPAEVTVTLSRVASLRVPIRTVVTQEPPSGYTYPLPTCNLTEVTASGPADRIGDITAMARLNLSEVRAPVSLTVNLFAANQAGRFVSEVTLDPAQVTCQVNVAQIEGISELSVVPDVSGFPPPGYIYEGYEFTPGIVTVSGDQRAIRALNGVVNTETIDITDATSNFERTVLVKLPEGVRLVPETQSITVTVKIGTVRGSRQYSDIPIQVEGLAPGLDADLLPNAATVLLVGPQPILEQINNQDLTVEVNLSQISEPGTYQVTAVASVSSTTISDEDIVAETTLTVQPQEVNVTVESIEGESSPGD